MQNHYSLLYHEEVFSTLKVRISTRNCHNITQNFQRIVYNIVLWGWVYSMVSTCTQNPGQTESRENEAQ